MKFIVANKIPENESFHPLEEGWKPLKEPKSIIVTMLLSLPIGLIASCIVVAVANGFGIKSDIDLNLSLLIALLIIVPVHELIHALNFPGSLKSDKVIFGLLPKAGAFYAHYEGEMNKRRFLLTLVSPFIVITIIPLILLCCFRINQPFIIKAAAVNSLCACADIFGCFLVLFQLPNNAIIRNKGIKTYWK